VPDDDLVRRRLRLVTALGRTKDAKGTKDTKDHNVTEGTPRL